MWQISDLHTRLTRDLVPIVVAFTKFDQAVAIEGGNFMRTDALTRIEQSCRSLFRRELGDVPEEIVSGTSSAFLSQEWPSDHCMYSK